MKGQVKPTMEFNAFENYAGHALRPQNAESGETDIKNIGEKFQDNNESILHENIRNLR